jgi:hypothetical protein
MREAASADRQRMAAGRLATRTGLVGREAGLFCAVRDGTRETRDERAHARLGTAAVTLRLARIPAYPHETPLPPTPHPLSRDHVSPPSPRSNGRPKADVLHQGQYLENSKDNHTSRFPPPATSTNPTPARTRDPSPPHHTHHTPHTNTRHVFSSRTRPRRQVQQGQARRRQEVLARPAATQRRWRGCRHVGCTFLLPLPPRPALTSHRSSRPRSTRSPRKSRLRRSPAATTRASPRRT